MPHSGGGGKDGGVDFACKARFLLVDFAYKTWFLLATAF